MANGTRDVPSSPPLPVAGAPGVVTAVELELELEPAAGEASLVAAPLGVVEVGVATFTGAVPAGVAPPGVVATGVLPPGVVAGRVGVEPPGIVVEVAVAVVDGVEVVVVRVGVAAVAEAEAVAVAVVVVVAVVVAVAVVVGVAGAVPVTLTVPAVDDWTASAPPLVVASCAERMLTPDAPATWPVNVTANSSQAGAQLALVLTATTCTVPALLSMTGRTRLVFQLPRPVTTVARRMPGSNLRPTSYPLKLSPAVNPLADTVTVSD